MLPHHAQMLLPACGSSAANLSQIWLHLLPGSLTGPRNSQGVIAQSALQENCVAALGVKGNFMFESATHRLVSTPLTRANMHDPAVMQALSLHLL